ncbi:Protein CBG27629 [Caenorhabditis briggsae]|uniref:Protein CBG27629 n=1 Tax=Caenorhabditis briggsae TaxID=6238 RepID=B6IJ74_CAEBR|nr:Protein CBG27629 [Caenorhabditis briggsae]CAR99908.1 Protein CBG27629 [Caenorhabditis briggsae]
MKKCRTFIFFRSESFLKFRDIFPPDVSQLQRF